ncbi:MAG: DMT family transporter [Pseudomonadota bacterium]
MSETGSDTQKGILAIIAVTLLFVAMDATGKHLSQTHDPMFVVWARYAGQAIITIVFFAPRIAAISRTSNLKLQILRSGLLFGATLFFFNGFALMPLAEVTAIGEIGPLFILALAAIILREKVGMYRWSAVIAGFIGAMIIVQPGTEAFQLAALLPVGGAFCFAAYSISTRYLGAADSVWTTFFYTGMVGAVGATILVPFYWVTPQPSALPFLFLVGALGAAGQGMLILAMRFAPASLLAPFFYIQLVWSVILGFLVFGDIPATTTIIGASIIVFAGLFVHWRERKLASDE